MPTIARPDFDEDDETLDDEEFNEDVDFEDEEGDFDPDGDDAPETWQLSQDASFRIKLSHLDIVG